MRHNVHPPSTTKNLLLANLIVILLLLAFVFYQPSPNSSQSNGSISLASENSNTINSIEIHFDTKTLPVFKCTDLERRLQANNFKQNKEDWLTHFKLGCTEPIRLDSFLSFLWPLSQRPITVVNVGANKGYNLVRWWEAWSPKSGINSRSWGDYLKQEYHDYFANYTLCGTCWYCAEKLFDTYHRDVEPINLKSFRIIGVEPSQANYDLLEKLKDWSNNSVIETYNFAASNESGEAKFPVTRLGWTRASLSDASSSTNELKTIRVVTVDEMMAEFDIPSIEYLLIDTEGYDPLVIRGARNALAGAKISVIEFEYTVIGMWKTTSLEETVDFLSDFQYDCYLKIPEGHLVRLTECFHREAYEFYVVSNVLCVHRSQYVLNEYLLSHCYWL